ncbi:MAG: hypothetical protein ACPGU1_08795 [Myxococcota bacterium]
MSDHSSQTLRLTSAQSERAPDALAAMCDSILEELLSDEPET